MLKSNGKENGKERKKKHPVQSGDHGIIWKHIALSAVTVRNLVLRGSGQHKATSLWEQSTSIANYFLLTSLMFLLTLRRFFFTAARRICAIRGYCSVDSILFFLP